MDGHQWSTSQVYLRELEVTLECSKLTGQEYAGLPGSSKHAKYLKSTTHTQLSRALYPGSSIASSLAFTVAKLMGRTTP
jgi:hypothetical protein